MSFFSSSPAIDHERVVNAVQAAERRTSGEIRVLIGRGKAEEPVPVAQAHFERLGMTKTAERNGVLIFFAPRSHTFAIVGDTAIHAKCGQDFWKLVASAMEIDFKRGAFTEGLVNGVGLVGSLLAEHFPRRTDDQNELPNRVEEG